MRVARPARRRLVRAIHRTSRPVSNPCVLSDGCVPAKPGDADILGASRAAMDQSGCGHSGVQIPCRGLAADRPKGRGPLNLPGVGSSCAMTHVTGANQHRVSEEVSEREKLNHERPEPSWRQGLAGEFDRRRCRTGNACCRWVERSFWFLPLESVSNEGTATAPGRKPRTCDDRTAG